MNILIYITRTGKEPFSVWHDNLDIKTRAIIRTRLDRIRLGNFGDSKRMKNGEGVWELRINYGPGYRIYYGKKGIAIIVLLIGGSKRSQSSDIAKARQYWKECKDLKL